MTIIVLLPTTNQSPPLKYLTTSELFSHLSGLAYNGLDKDGEVLWNGGANVRLRIYEKASRFHNVSDATLEIKVLKQSCSLAGFESKIKILYQFFNHISFVQQPCRIEASKM